MKKLSERIRTCMTTPMTEFSVDGPKDKWTFQLIDEQLWVADEVAQLEQTNAALLEALEAITSTVFGWINNMNTEAEMEQAALNAEETIRKAKGE